MAKRNLSRFDLDENVAKVNMKALHERDKGKVPLKINRTLTILVTKEKATPAYAEEYRQRMENKVITH